MDTAKELGFKPPTDFQEDARDPLIELDTTDSKEFWLIQWPKDQIPDFDGQQISLDLHHHDGQLGTFEGSSGKSYDVVSLAAQEPNATVFLSSAAESKIVGKITRRVSFVHYMEPSEVPKNDNKKLKQLHERSTVTSLTNSAHRISTPTKSIRPRQLPPASGLNSTHSSGGKSLLSKEKVQSKDSMERQVAPEHSQEKKARRIKKHED